MSNSNINTRFNLVHSEEVNYPDDSLNGMDEALYDLTDNTGVFDNVEDLRTEYGADQVTLLRRFVDEGCGLAWLPRYDNAGSGVCGCSRWFKNRRFRILLLRFDLCP